jgi:hypothetical protein
MANTFLRKLGRNIGTSLTAVDSYTVGANVGAVIVGLNISNTSAAQIIANVVINNGTDNFYLGNRIPVAAGGAVSIAGGDQKIILQTGDSVRVNSSAAGSVDVLMNIMETDGAGITTDPVTYSITSNISSVNEGNTVGFTVSTSSVPNSTVLYWTTVGNVASADFSDSVTSGNVTVTGGSATITRTLTVDATTEGVEYFDLELRTGSTSGTIVATSGNITVNDTSLTAAYSITSNISSVNEGNTVGFTVSTSNVPNSTILYWTTVGNVASADFSDSVTSGNVTIANSSATITRTLTADATTEGVEYFDLELRTGSTSGTIVATSGNITVNDTSQAPIAGPFSGRVAGVVGNYGSPVAIRGQTSTGTLATFTNSTSAPAATGRWINIASSDTVAMAVSTTGNAAITTDGSTWTAVTSLPTFNPYHINLIWSGFAYGGSTWVAIAGGSSATSTQVAYSTNNGTSWTSINPLPSGYQSLLRYANGNFLIAGNGYNSAYSSADGINWVTSGATTATAAYSDNLFYAAGTVNAWYLIRTIGITTLRVQASTDTGATWSSNDRTVTGISGGGTVYPRWGNGVFVAIQQQQTTVWTSTDAVSWTPTTNAFGADSNDTYFVSLVFTNGYFIATTSQFASFNYNIWFSSNGTTWTKSATVGTNQISRITGLT